MANASIEVHRRRVTEEVYKGRPIGAHEYFLEFSIAVDEEGCYAIHVALFDEDDITANDQFASTNDAELQCYCLKASVPKKFYITGAAPAPTGSAMPPRSDGIPSTIRWKSSLGSGSFAVRKVLARVMIAVRFTSGGLGTRLRRGPRLETMWTSRTERALTRASA